MRATGPRILDYSRGTTKSKRKDTVHFGTNSTDKGPLESIFRQLDFKPMLFGTFREMSSNVKDFVDLDVDYGT
jgi:hypothetical protein